MRQSACSTVRVRPPGIEWRTGRNPKMGKNWPKNRKWPSARNGEKMAQIAPNPIFSPSHFGPRAIFFFWPIFCHFWISARFPFYTVWRAQGRTCTELPLRFSPVRILVGACLATGDRIFAFATGSDSVSKSVFAILWLFLLDFRAYNHGLKGTQKPKTYCDNTSFAILSFTRSLIVRSGPVWRQDLAVLSPEGPRDSTCQLRSGSRKRRVEFKGGSLHDGFGSFDGFGGSGERLAPLLLILQNTVPSGNHDGFDGFGGFGGCGGFGRDGYPP